MFFSLLIRFKQVCRFLNSFLECLITIATHCLNFTGDEHRPGTHCAMQTPWQTSRCGSLRQPRVLAVSNEELDGSGMKSLSIARLANVSGWEQTKMADFERTLCRDSFACWKHSVRRGNGYFSPTTKKAISSTISQSEPVTPSRRWGTPRFASTTVTLLSSFRVWQVDGNANMAAKRQDVEQEHR